MQDNTLTSSTANKQDEFDIYAERVANTLRNLQNGPTQTFAMFEINDILQTAEMMDNEYRVASGTRSECINSERSTPTFSDVAGSSSLQFYLESSDEDGVDTTTP